MPRGRRGVWHQAHFVSVSQLTEPSSFLINSFVVVQMWGNSMSISVLVEPGGAGRAWAVGRGGPHRVGLGGRTGLGRMDGGWEVGRGRARPGLSGRSGMEWTVGVERSGMESRVWGGQG